MQKHNFITLVLALTMTVVGCESDDNTTNPVAPAEYQIYLENLPDSLVWLAGSEMSIPVNALVLNKDGGIAPGVRVEFTVTSGQGSFDTPGNVTDQHGRISAVGTLIPSDGWQEFSPLFIAGGASAGKSIAIHGVRQPVTIAFDAPATTFKVVSGESVETVLTATFSDVRGVGIAGLPVRVGLYGADKAEDMFGTVSAPALTDEAGGLEIRYNSSGGLGRINVYVETYLPGMADWLDSTLTLTFQRLTNDIGSMTIRVTPNYHFCSPDSLVTSQVRIQVLDLNNVGIPGIIVALTTDFGSISRIPPTDASGEALATWRNEYMAGIAILLASIPGTPFEVTSQIHVASPPWGPGRLSVWTNTDLIYADNGLTTATITALLQDRDNQVLAGEQLIFTSTHGAISSPLTTDRLGRVVTVFTDLGVPSINENGELVPAKIYVKYPPLNLIDSCEVTIAPRNPVGSITLTCNKNQMVAASGDSAIFRATVILPNGDFATSGTLVQFEVGRGNGTFSESAVLVGHFGIAETYYIAGNFVGVAIIRAFVENDDGTLIYSNEVRITLMSGPPNLIRLLADPTQLNANDPFNSSTITAFVSDTAGNPVTEGTLVTFSTTIGSITRSAILNDGGQATVRLFPDGRVGVADVRGLVMLPGGGQIEGYCNVTFVGGAVNSIRITAEPEVIQAAESGGISNSTIRAELYDASGALINYSTTVVFELPDEPEIPDGCSWPNRQQIDSVRTGGGVAVKNLNAGLRTGPVFIRVYSWRDSARTDTVRAQGYFVTVEEGADREPPNIEIDYIPDGEDAGGGVWQIPVRASLTDSHGNPWRYEIPVGFTVIPDDAGTIEAGETGNDIGFGSQRGVAWSWLYYHSVNTLDTVAVRAEVQTEDGAVSAEIPVCLPLQDATLELNVDPQNWMFDRDQPEDTCLVRIWGIVTDGHQINIDGVPVRVRVDRGTLYRRLPGGGYERLGREGIMITGHELWGSLYLRISLEDVQDLEFEGSIHVLADIPGYDVQADPAFVFITFR